METSWDRLGTSRNWIALDLTQIKKNKTVIDKSKWFTLCDAIVPRKSDLSICVINPLLLLELHKQSQERQDQDQEKPMHNQSPMGNHSTEKERPRKL